MELGPGRPLETATPAAPAFDGTIDCVPVAQMEADVAAWDSLARRTDEPNPFFESWYLLPSLRNLDPAGKTRILRFEHGGQLAGIMPLARPRSYYGWLIPYLACWLHANIFLCAPLVARGLERTFWRALLVWADANAELGLFLHFPEFPLTGALFAALQDVVAEQNRKAVIVHRKERAMLDSALSPGDYFENSLSAKKRKELRRQTSRLAELGELSFERRDDAAGLDRWIDDLLRLEASGWKGRAGSALACDSATETLLRQSLAGASQRGRLERLSLSLDDRPIAMLANFLTPPGAYSYKTAFAEDLARFSPGVLLQRENLGILDRPDIAWTDSCASSDHPMIDRIWRERRPIGRISIAIGGRVRRAAFSRLVGLEIARNPQGVQA